MRHIGSIVHQPQFENYNIKNEPILSYEKNSKERKELEKALKKISSKTEDIPIIIGDREIFDGKERYQVMPHSHKEKIARFYWADERVINDAIKVSMEAQKQWDKTTFEDRVRIWERAADLMAGPYRQELNAATMLGQSKTVIQAEIDSAAGMLQVYRS